MVQVNEIIHNRWLNKNMEVMCDLKKATFGADE